MPVGGRSDRRRPVRCSSSKRARRRRSKASVGDTGHRNGFPKMYAELPEQAAIMIHFPRGKSVVIPVDQISELEDVPADALPSITLSFAGTALSLVDRDIDISIEGLLKSRQGKDGSGSPEDRFDANAAKFN